MGLRHSALAALGLSTLSALCVGFVDVPLARAATSWTGAAHVARVGTNFLDRVSGKDLADSALPIALLVAALFVRRWPERRALARILMLVALTCFASHLVVGSVKPLAGRLRPYEIAEGGWVDRFFAGGNSFPSGHTAYYWGLALPLARAWPRRRIGLVLPAAFVAVARVVEGDHFAGDVLASLAIVVLLSAVLEALFPRERSVARASPSGV